MRNGHIVAQATETPQLCRIVKCFGFSGLFVFSFSGCQAVQVAGNTAASTAVVAASPAITSQPCNTTVSLGQSSTFTVTATGTGTLTYQWQENSADISGATSSSYTTPATAAADNGSTFDVVVTNSAGSTTSNSATLSVLAPAQVSYFVSTVGNDTG